MEWLIQHLFSLLYFYGIFLSSPQNVKRNFAQIQHGATPRNLLSVYNQISICFPHTLFFQALRASVTQDVKNSSDSCIGLCVRNCARMNIAVHACVSAAAHAFLSGRHLWQTKMALCPSCGMALCFSRVPAAQHSLRSCIHAFCP